LARAASTAAPSPVRWAALLCALGEAQIDALCQRLRAPNEYRELALLAARLTTHLQRSAQPLEQLIGEPEALLKLYELADAFRRPERFALWLQVLAIRAESAAPPTAHIANSMRRLRTALAAASAVKLPESQLRALQGPAIATQLRALRLAALEHVD
jgi:tRNA nucleotidyltransferase (CCA-adding enzyme)